MIRLLVTGSRDYADAAAVRSGLDQAQRFLKDREVTLVHGAARGADALAAAEAERRGWVLEAHPADWTRHGKMAGPMRNNAMVAAGADLVIAFPQGESRGTRGCMKVAGEAGIPILDMSQSSPHPTITRLVGAFEALANDSMAHPFSMQDSWPASAEHHLQAFKTTDAAQRVAIYDTASVAEAVRRGGQVAARPGWDEGMKIVAMERILAAKFSVPENADVLTRAARYDIVAGNTVHETFWGCCWCPTCGGAGRNQLGELLTLMNHYDSLDFLPDGYYEVVDGQGRSFGTISIVESVWLTVDGEPLPAEWNLANLRVVRSVRPARH